MESKAKLRRRRQKQRYQIVRNGCFRVIIIVLLRKWSKRYRLYWCNNESEGGQFQWKRREKENLGPTRSISTQGMLLFLKWMMYWHCCYKMILNDTPLFQEGDFHKKYDLQDMLGIGSTCVCHMCQKRATNVRFACKIVDRRGSNSSSYNVETTDTITVRLGTVIATSCVSKLTGM